MADPAGRRGDFRLDALTPWVGASTAWFEVTDDVGRLCYPGLESLPLYCTIFTVYEV